MLQVLATMSIIASSKLCAIGASVAMVEWPIRGAVARRALAPRRATVLVAGARDEAVHGGGTGLLHADAVATTGEEQLC